MNATRTNMLSRQSSGRKMDYLSLKNGRTEVGCGECGLIGGVNTIKELHDATFKMPKVMKDMMINLVSLSPSLKQELVVSGLYIGEDKLKLLVLDCPSGYVARFNAFEPVFYPDNESKLYHKLSAFLKVIFASRILMKTTVQKMDSNTIEISIGRRKSKTKSLVSCLLSTTRSVNIEYTAPQISQSCPHNTLFR